MMRSRAWTFPDRWRDTPKNYFKLVETVGRAINQIDPEKYVVISGVGMWGFADNYNWMHPVNVRNSVYSFNPYIPSAFANSGKKGRPIVNYISEKERGRLMEKMLPVQNFAKKHNANIIVVGFGLPYHTEGKGARDWMEDMLNFFEKNKWSWMYFSYGIPFRSPEVVGPAGKGEWIRSEDTERLTILKQYWRLNSDKKDTSFRMQK
ncbi:glycoside hydrolase family 5 protein [Candidatus Roizmanbacteria bacterium]|nr:glycoside hydrolase family 5 protein [Candidatus Roizmanbacteria bacterium]